MDLGLAAYLLMLGLFAFLLANSEALMSRDMIRERFRRSGVFRSLGAPAADASDAFVERVVRRGRRAAVGSAALILLVIAAWLIARPEVTPTAANLELLVAAFSGRAFALGVLNRREVAEVPAGPRVASGGVRTLRDRVPLAGWAVLPLVQVVFLGLYVSASPGGDLPWVLGVGAASVVLTAAGWAFASWLAHQPQGASDAVELAWADAIRAHDVALLLFVGPLSALAVGVTSFVDSATPMRNPVFPLAIYTWGYLIVIGVLAVVLTMWAGRRGVRVAEEVGHAGR